MSGDLENTSQNIDGSSDRPSEPTLEELKHQRSLASDPMTPPALLQKLSKSRDCLTRRSVTANPNTPLDVLCGTLADEFPEEIRNNPIFPLTFLENPTWIPSLSANCLENILKLNPVPLAFIVWASYLTEKGIPLALALNPETPKVILEKLKAKYGNDSVLQSSINLHINLAGEMKSGWVEQVKIEMEKLARPMQPFSYPFYLQQFTSLGRVIIPEFFPVNSLIRFSLASNSKTSSTLLEELARDQDWSIREWVAFHENTPVYILKKWARNDQAQIREWVAENINLPPFWLEQLAKDSVVAVRQRVAEHPHTPIAGLEQLASDPEMNVRVLVAAHPCTPSHILDRLSFDPCPGIRQWVAQHPHTPVTTLKRLATDSDILTRFQVAANPNTSEEILDELAFEESVGIQKALARHPNTSPKLLTRLFATNHLYILQLIAFHPHTPVSLFNKLANKKEDKIDFLLAKNPKTPIHIVKKLAAHHSFYIRALIGKHPHTPIPLLQRLAMDPKKTVQVTILKNPQMAIALHRQEKSIEIINLPYPIQSPVLQRIHCFPLWQNLVGKIFHDFPLKVSKHSPCFATTILWRLAHDFNVLVRAEVAKYLNTPLYILNKLAADWERDVRVAVVKNPHLPFYTLLMLSTDEAVEVRIAVAQLTQIPLDLLKHLARDHSSQVRAAVASHPHVTGSLLEPLALDPVAEVRMAVARNSQTPLELLEQLATDPVYHVRYWTTQHSQISVKILEQFLTISPDYENKDYFKIALNYIKLNPGGISFILEQFARFSPLLLYRLLALSQPDIPLSLLMEKVKSYDWLERYIIAQHLNTPLHTLQVLARDANRIVRAAAKAQLEQRKPSKSGSSEGR